MSKTSKPAREELLRQIAEKEQSQVPNIANTLIPIGNRELMNAVQERYAPRGEPVSDPTARKIVNQWKAEGWIGEVEGQPYSIPNSISPAVGSYSHQAAEQHREAGKKSPGRPQKE